MKLPALRVPATRIWRAFPELDGFSDEECRNYVREARRRRWWVGLVLQLAGAVVGFASWVVFMVVLVWATTSIGFQPSNLSGPVWLLWSFGLIGSVVVFPAFGALLSRDFWLRRAVRSRLQSASCGGCGYTLLGLVLTHDDARGPCVTCPECGTRTFLDRAGLTPEDLLSESGPSNINRAATTHDRVLGDDRFSIESDLYRALIRQGVPREDAVAALDEHRALQPQQVRRAEVAGFVAAGLLLAGVGIVVFSNIVPPVAWAREFVRPIQWGGGAVFFGLLFAYGLFLVVYGIVQNRSRARFVKRTVRASTGV